MLWEVLGRQMLLWGGKICSGVKFKFKFYLELCGFWISSNFFVFSLYFFDKIFCMKLR
ncbi:MAG TPA: hypothetical protein P5543_01795 [Planctomycetota bacterium]|nr:hypothetical protein [Planctomycetota bacterium]